MEKTFISIEFWQLVGFFLGFLSLLFTFGKMLFSRFEKELDDRQKHNEKVHSKVENLEGIFINLKTELPLTYVRRDDYIRGQTILEAKIDALQKTLTDFYQSRGSKNE